MVSQQPPLPYDCMNFNSFLWFHEYFYKNQHPFHPIQQDENSLFSISRKSSFTIFREKPTSETVDKE